MLFQFCMSSMSSDPAESRKRILVMDEFGGPRFTSSLVFPSGNRQPRSIRCRTSTPLTYPCHYGENEELCEPSFRQVQYVSYLTVGNNKIVEPGFRHISTPSSVAQEILKVSTEVKYALEKRICVNLLCLKPLLDSHLVICRIIILRS